MKFSIFLLYFLTMCKSDIKILDSGTVPVGKYDMALIFFVTLENTSDKNLEISAKVVRCCEDAKTHDNECKSMSLIGGDMGILSKKLVRNITLIYPNLYLFKREGGCTVSIEYRVDTLEQSLVHDIKFCTNGSSEDQCSTIDQDPWNNCSPVDCVIKYSGERSFYNEGCGECEEVPVCMNDPNKCVPELSYSLITNNCTNLNNSITPFDLDLLEKEVIDTSEDVCSMPNLICHQGTLDFESQCQCFKGWVNSLNENEDYMPSLLHYHMCNIEIGTWNSVNKDRIKATALIIGILTLTVVSKIIILMCVLNWCYKHFRKPQEKICADHTADFDPSLILCENMGSSVDKCICKQLSEQRLPTLINETVNVCYYPCRPSSTTTDGKVAKSIVLSKTTSSSIQDSSQTDTECEGTTEETQSSDEDYEIQFSEDDGAEEESSSDALHCDQQSDHSAVNIAGSSESRQISGESKARSRHPSDSNNVLKQSGSSTKE